MILRLDADQLRKIAAQLDALTAMAAAGADLWSSNTPIMVDGQGLAYAHWWEDLRQYTAEFISFTPAGAAPLFYHRDDSKVTR